MDLTLNPVEINNTQNKNIRIKGMPSKDVKVLINSMAIFTIVGIFIFLIIIIVLIIVYTINGPIKANTPFLKNTNKLKTNINPTPPPKSGCGCGGF